MSKYSDFLKTKKENDIKFFFGEVKRQSNNYFKFEHKIDEDNIIIVTNNIKLIKGTLVLIVDKNKAVYLKDWQVKPVKNFYENFESFAVKLNRNFFKAYTFGSDFEDFSFEKEDDFDTLKEVAEKQNEISLSLGHFNY